MGMSVDPQKVGGPDRGRISPLPIPPLPLPSPSFPSFTLPSHSPLSPALRSRPLKSS